MIKHKCATHEPRRPLGPYTDEINDESEWLDDVEKELGQNAVKKRIQAREKHGQKSAASEAIIMKHGGIGLYTKQTRFAIEVSTA
ncbi:MAG: hypothetical protein Q9197_004881 [Variospora fuerteventurae]